MDISRPVKRFDFDEKITGEAKYCSDLKFDGLLYARTLRSDKPRARITSIDYPDLPEGYYIVDKHDIMGKNVDPVVYDDQPFFADDIVNYIGEPILLVVGKDKKVVLEILQKIKVNYIELNPILTMDEAKQRKEDFIFHNKPVFVEYEFAKGNFEHVAKGCSRIVEDEYRTGYQEQAYLETQSMVARMEGEELVVAGSMQCPFYVKEALRQALAWPEDKIQVVQLPTGGGFGGKEDYASMIGVHAGLAALKTQKPVQLVLDRQEDIICTTKRHPSCINLKSFIDDAGNIAAVDIDASLDGGAYAGLSSVVLQRLIFTATGVYDIPHLRVRGRVYVTNNVPAGAFRGFGGPQAIFAIEMHMNKVAAYLGMDAKDLKKKYFLKNCSLSATGGHFRNEIMLNEIARKIEKLTEARDMSYGVNTCMRGIGYSFFLHGCGFTGRGEQALLKPKVGLRKFSDNSVELLAATSEIGQGGLTALRKIVAETLGIPLDAVKIGYPDTDKCLDSGPTVASRTVMIVGKLVHDCALKMKKRWSESEFELVQEYEYPKNLHWDNNKFFGNAYPEYSWGANAVEVEIDPLTYEVRTTGIWAVYDVGTAIDELIVRGQIEGGLLQGLGLAGMEVMKVKNGKLLQSNFTDYIIPCAADFPSIVSEFIDNPYKNGPFGARGLGELATVGIAPAFAQAVQNAIGKSINELPVTPEYIMELMKNA